MKSAGSGQRAFVGGQTSQNSPGEPSVMVDHLDSYFKMMMLFLSRKQERRTGFQGAVRQHGTSNNFYAYFQDYVVEA